jgi:hypothetical protein
MLRNGLQVDLSIYKSHLDLVCSRISSSCILKCEHMTLAISRLNNIFSLHIRTQTIFSSFPMCENVNNLSLEKLLISMNNIILTISGRTNFLIGWKVSFSVGVIWAIFFWIW